MFGAHLSIAGGLHNALLAAERYGFQTLQIFTNSLALRQRTTDSVMLPLQARIGTRMLKIPADRTYGFAQANNLPGGDVHRLAARFQRRRPIGL